MKDITTPISQSIDPKINAPISSIINRHWLTYTLPNIRKDINTNINNNVYCMIEDNISII